MQGNVKEETKARSLRRGWHKASHAIRSHFSKRSSSQSLSAQPAANQSPPTATGPITFKIAGHEANDFRRYSAGETLDAQQPNQSPPTATGPITFKIAGHEANDFRRYSAGEMLDAQQLLSKVWRVDGVGCKEMLQSSYQPNENFVPNSNGFINCVIQAYNHHHHLVIRPDDLWTAIVAQMNLYVNAHAEELRSKFVAHEGKETLKVRSAAQDRYSADFGELAKQMGDLLKINIKDPSLHDWIIPNFSTTTPNDVIACSVMMMSTLKAYFSYYFAICCGIPSITLLGDKEDYISILRRTEKLAEFGEEPRFFGRLLQPILTEFCNAFDTVAKGEVPNPEFWGRICHYQVDASGPDYVGGWIGAFCVFNGKGEWQGQKLEDIEKPLTNWEMTPPLVLAGLRYPVIDSGEIPDGFCDVDVLLDEYGTKFDCKMVAGHVGYTASARDGQLNTLQPSSEWFMFIKSGIETEKQAEQRIITTMGMS